jgi:hypothetical protein
MSTQHFDLAEKPDDAQRCDQCEMLVWVRQKALLMPQSGSTQLQRE